MASRKTGWKQLAKYGLVAVAVVLGYDFYKGHTNGPVAGPRATSVY